MEGLPCDQQTIDGMHAVGGNEEMQRGMRIGFSPDLSADKIDALVTTGMKVSNKSTAELFDAWSGGVPDGKKPSPFNGPVLAIGGAEDPFASPAVIKSGVAPRFEKFQSICIDGASHWAHVSQAEVVSGMINDFMKKL